MQDPEDDDEEDDEPKKKTARMGTVAKNKAQANKKQKK